MEEVDSELEEVAAGVEEVAFELEGVAAGLEGVGSWWGSGWAWGSIPRASTKNLLGNLGVFDLVAGGP